jgi:hypothetical protein
MRILHVPYVALPSAHNCLTQDVLELLQLLLTVDHPKRVALDAVVGHPWLANFGSAENMRHLLLKQRLSKPSGRVAGGKKGIRGRVSSVISAEELRGRVRIADKDFRRWLVPNKAVLRTGKKVRRDDLVSGLESSSSSLDLRAI